MVIRKKIQTDIYETLEKWSFLFIIYIFPNVIFAKKVPSFQ